MAPVASALLRSRLMFDLFKNHRRAELRKQGLAESERAIVSRHVPELARLDAAERGELEGLVRVFLAEKSFEGCGGLELTEEIQVTIAAEACLLLLHRDNDMYPGVDVILVYPAAYWVESKTHDGAVVIEGPEARLGESWARGLVVLAWDHVSSRLMRAGGHNVVLHEFAHQLDGENGSMDGTPPLTTGARYSSWGRVLGQEFTELSERLHAGKPNDIDAYGATNPAEFFAVVTEMFFERAAAMKARHPELYAELAAFYHQDPAARETG
jgi:Mlc titration factor MtfA (ptsG expression regulator)